MSIITIILLAMSKRHRIRAHVNPLALGDYEYPSHPTHVPWHLHYPLHFTSTSATTCESTSGSSVTIADCGCGFGGLLVTLSPLFPKKLIIGMEIRPKVVKLVKKRIQELRETGGFANCSVERINIMKFFPNYFERGQLEKMFFCFPDPHFKKANHRRRIISHNLLSEYAYALKEGGLLFTISDVEDLADWMARHAGAHPMFERIPNETIEEYEKNNPTGSVSNVQVNDMNEVVVCVNAMKNGTEEGQKVTRNGGSKFYSVFRKRTPL